MRTLASVLWTLGGPAVGMAATPTASSVGTNMDGVKHPATHAFDGLLATGWAEGQMGEGEDSWIEIRFDRPTDVGSVSIWPGWLGGSNREIREYGRPRAVTLTFAVAGGDPVTHQDVILDPGESGPLRHDIEVDVPGARSVRITLDEVYRGGIHSDTFIAEVAVNLVAGAPPKAVDDVATWVASDTGQRAASSHREAIIALYDAINAEQFGDRDSLRQLMDWAADGAPYLRARVASRVPAGFRLNALKPDATAIEALLKLKDANAIPAVERAALRSTGALAEELGRRAAMFAAYSEILGGTLTRNVPPWGKEGIAKGALRSLEEPLNLAIDDYGGLYVADVCNHRVQRFSLDTGIVEEVWGTPEPGLTDTWFYKTREFYASGAVPAATEGSFVHPVDLVVSRGKSGDHVYVLDVGAEPGHDGTWGRITHITPDGRVAHTEGLPFEQPISGNVSGEGHLVMLRGQLVVLWANEGAVLDVDDWTITARFDMEDGAPSGAIAYKGNKIGLIYDRDLVLYSTDGFRHGSVIGPEQLGRGYEDWALGYDDRGKLWAVLDTGEVVKFKGKKKVDFRFTLGDYSLTVPRIAVFDDHVFVTSRDQILRGDALQLYAEQSSGQTRDNLDMGDP